MIEFLRKHEVATPERMANKYVFGTLPLNDYKSQFIGSPSHVLSSNSAFVKGNPIRVAFQDDGSYCQPNVVHGEVHRRETAQIRVICDTLEEVEALMNTRHPIQAIINKYYGHIEPAEISKKIEAVYDEVKARFNAPKVAAVAQDGVEQRQAARDALLSRVSARLERHQVPQQSVPSHIERVVQQPAVTFGRRM
ncbi:hypothetical protein O9X98_11030 [Agrobacterium salinitolerans]|nr:hypothetical protein [Agrobacterium salinitolerans]